MTRPRGRPARGAGLEREEILAAALALLDEGGGAGLTMRALAGRLHVTPMSLYRHVGDHVGLLRALSDRVYGAVLDDMPRHGDAKALARQLLLRYHLTVSRHPQLALAIFATPEAFAGVTRAITDRLAGLLSQMAAEPGLWCEILVDHAHGSGLALAMHRGQQARARMRDDYGRALDLLLDRLAPPAA